MTPEQRDTLTRMADPAVVQSLADTSDVFVLALLDSSPDCIKIVEPDGTLSYMNPNGQCAMEIDDFTLVAGAPWSTLWPEETQADIKASVQAALAGETTRLEAFCPTAKGKARWWDISVSPVRGPDGKVLRVLSVSRDITPLIEREDKLRTYDLQLKELNEQLADDLDEAEVLMREVDHRVKNSLAMVAGMLRMQARQVGNDTTQDVLNEASARVQTVARVHERLQKGRDVTRVALSEYLPAMARDLAGALAKPGVEICTDVAEVDVPSEMAVSLGLIAAEMLTNAFKHAFADEDEPCEVVLNVEAREAGLHIEVRDNGRGGCEAFEGEGHGAGLGTRVITMYVEQLGANLSCHSPTGEGTTLTLDVPL